MRLWVVDAGGSELPVALGGSRQLLPAVSGVNMPGEPPTCKAPRRSLALSPKPFIWFRFNSVLGL